MSKQAIDRGALRWHWRTWNLLLQIREAMDGEDARQRSGEMDTRGLCIVAGRSEMRALRSRKWIHAFDSGELFDDEGNARVLPIWEITKAGRKALDAVVAAGVSIR